MPPHILFLPGAGGSPAFWRPPEDLLPAAWRKTYLGWPGLGVQPHDPAVQGFDDLVALAARQIDRPLRGSQPPAPTTAPRSRTSPRQHS